MVALCSEHEAFQVGLQRFLILASVDGEIHQLHQARFCLQSCGSSTLRKKGNTHTHKFKSYSIWMFPKIGVPQNGWCIMETLLKWMIWGYHYFWKHPSPSNNAWSRNVTTYRNRNGIVELWNPLPQRQQNEPK